MTAEGQTLKDSFQWNVDEKEMTPETFARSLCYDLNLSHHFEHAIIESMQEQLGSCSYAALKLDGEHRVTIKLEIRVGHQILRDQFEWDMGEPTNDPETFAQSMCADMGLGPEYVTEIAQTIREQLNEHSSEMLTNKNRMRHEEFAVVASRAIRPPQDLPDWEPSLDDMTPEELEAAAKDEERQARIAARESRKQPRSRGGGADYGDPKQVTFDAGAVMENFRRQARNSMAHSRTVRYAESATEERVRKAPSNPFGAGGQPKEYKLLKGELDVLRDKVKLLKTGPPGPSTGQDIRSAEDKMNEIVTRMEVLVAAHAKSPGSNTGGVY